MWRRGVAAVWITLGWGLSDAAAEPPTAAKVDWTGVYFGVEGAGGWSDGSIFAHTTASRHRAGDGGAHTARSTSSTAGLFGALIGYNQQFGSIVTGLEVDAMRVPESGAHVIASYRARLGWSFGNALLYLTAGAVTQKATLVRHAAYRNFVRGPLTVVTQSESERYDGYVVGGGVEYRLTSHLGLRAEGLYLGEGNERFTFPAVQTGSIRFRDLVPPATVDWSLEKVTVRVALTYRFD